MTLSDKLAADALLRLLQLMRDTGRRQGRIEVLVNDGNAEALRIVRTCEKEVLVISN